MFAHWKSRDRAGTGARSPQIAVVRESARVGCCLSLLRAGFRLSQASWSLRVSSPPSPPPRPVEVRDLSLAKNATQESAPARSRIFCRACETSPILLLIFPLPRRRRRLDDSPRLVRFALLLPFDRSYYSIPLLPSTDPSLCLILPLPLRLPVSPSLHYTSSVIASCCLLREKLSSRVYFSFPARITLPPYASPTRNIHTTVLCAHFISARARLGHERSLLLSGGWRGRKRKGRAEEKREGRTEEKCDERERHFAQRHDRWSRPTWPFARSAVGSIKISSAPARRESRRAICRRDSDRDRNQQSRTRARAASFSPRTLRSGGTVDASTYDEASRERSSWSPVSPSAARLRSVSWIAALR